MFIPHMWDNEVERVGVQRCTPLGYALLGIGELIGLAGLLTLVAVPVYIIYRVIVGSFSWSQLWLLAVPLAIGLAGWLFVGVSRWMAARKQFQYDAEKIEASWIEKGNRQVLALDDWKAANRGSTS